MDIVDPLPPVKKLTDPYFSPCWYLLTIIGRDTRWIQATPVTEITSQNISTTLIDTRLSRFGVPLHIITDKGSKFESDFVFRVFHRLRTTSYNPQMNGLTGGAHRTPKQLQLHGRIHSYPAYLLYS